MIVEEEGLEAIYTVPIFFKAEFCGSNAGVESNCDGKR